MLRYIATAAAAILLLAVALKSRLGQGAPEDEVLAIGEKPVVRIEDGPSGRLLTVRHRLLGSASRASLIYELDGEQRTAARQTDCDQSLGTSPRDNGYTTEVELCGVVPDGASRIRLVVEAETGTTVVPVETP